MAHGYCARSDAGGCQHECKREADNNEPFVTLM
jgi:hypothetical protein